MHGAPHFSYRLTSGTVSIHVGRQVKATRDESAVISRRRQQTIMGGEQLHASQASSDDPSRIGSLLLW